MPLHPHAAALCALLDERWRAKVFHGGLVLLLPVIGWPAVLGYRAAFVRNLFRADGELLPAWDRGLAGFLVQGAKAMGVIFGYLSPLYAALALLLAERGWTPGPATGWLALGFVLVPIVSTLSFPTAVAILWLGPGQWLSTPEAALFLAGFATLLFHIPAGFLRVSRTGRYRAAFALGWTVPFVVRNFRAYCAAWWHSSTMAVVGHGALLFAPWGVVWCYLGIVVLFNEVLVVAGEAPQEIWLRRVLADVRFARGKRVGRSKILDAGGETVEIVDLAFTSVPLPRALARSTRTPSPPRAPGADVRARHSNSRTP